jgi:hypothetical protein
VQNFYAMAAPRAEAQCFPLPYRMVDEKVPFAQNLAFSCVTMSKIAFFIAGSRAALHVLAKAIKNITNLNFI